MLHVWTETFGLLRGGFSSGAPETKWKLTKSCLLPRFQPLDIPREAFTLPFISSLLGSPALTLTDWADFSSLPPGNIQTCTNCPSRSDYSIIQFFFFLRSVLKDLWAITGPLLVKYLSGQVEKNECVGVMKDSHSWVVQKEQVREDQSQISSCEFSLLSLWHIELKWLSFWAPWCFCGAERQSAAADMLGAYFKT